MSFFWRGKALARCDIKRKRNSSCNIPELRHKQGPWAGRPRDMDCKFSKTGKKENFLDFQELGGNARTAFVTHYEVSRGQYSGIFLKQIAQHSQALHDIVLIRSIYTYWEN